MRAAILILVTIVVGCRRDAAIVTVDGGIYCYGGTAECIGKACPNGYDIVAHTATDSDPAVDVIRCKP